MKLVSPVKYQQVQTANNEQSETDNHVDVEKRRVYASQIIRTDEQMLV